jgi:hypothetical protein
VLSVLVGRLPGDWGELIRAGEAAGKFRVLDQSTDPTRPLTLWAGLIDRMLFRRGGRGRR